MSEIFGASHKHRVKGRIGAKTARDHNKIPKVASCSVKPTSFQVGPLSLHQDHLKFVPVSARPHYEKALLKSWELGFLLSPSADPSV